MSRPRRKRPPMTPAECRQNSRAVLYRRVERAIEAGTPLAVIAREPDMPSRATLDRWLDSDTRLRTRYVAALELQRMVLAEECVGEADRQAQHARGRHRITALRGQIAARTRLVRLIEAAQKKANAEREAANDDAPARGISDEGVAMLEKAFDDVAVSNGSAPTTHTSEDLASEDLASEDLASEDLASEDLASEDLASEDLASEDPDVRLRGRDEETETPHDAEEEPSYAPEDARYRVAPDEDSEERQYRGSSPTVGEEEPPKARLAGKDPPPDKEKSPWKPDTPFTVRFDVGGEPAPRNGGMADFDPFDW